MNASYLSSCHGAQRETILAQWHMQSLAARCKVALLHANSGDTVCVFAPDGLRGCEIGALYVEAPKHSITYYPWRPWRLTPYLLFQPWNPSGDSWIMHELDLLVGDHHSNHIPEKTDDSGNSSKGISFLDVLLIIQQVWIMLCVVAYFALLCRVVIPMIVGRFITLTATGMSYLCMGSAFVVTAFALASGLHQFTYHTKKRTWEGILVISGGLLVPFAAHWMHKWVWLFGI